ncbi:hypothetical protein DFH09DRAFT_1166641 [Mycena vulgaris]|nr:hypothetical protein DFH09DRAFT_1166641 [Mycena vulgaris]
MDSTGNSKAGTKLKDDVMYDDWEFEARVELCLRGVLAVVFGDETRPMGSESTKAVKAWVTKRDIATATIISRLDLSQFAPIRNFEEDPVGMWERLRETHQSSGLGGVVAMWRKFYALRKPVETSTMYPHIAAVRGHAEKLGRIYNDKPLDAQIIATLLVSPPGVGIFYHAIPRDVRARCSAAILVPCVLFATSLASLVSNAKSWVTTRASALNLGRSSLSLLAPPSPPTPSRRTHSDGLFAPVGAFLLRVYFPVAPYINTIVPSR